MENNHQGNELSNPTEWEKIDFNRQRCTIHQPLAKLFFKLELKKKYPQEKHNFINSTHLEPINGAAVDERREHSEPVPEGIPNGTEGQHYMKVAADPLYELVVHVEWSHLNLAILCHADLLHLEWKN